MKYCCFHPISISYPISTKIFQHKNYSISDPTTSPIIIVLFSFIFINIYIYLNLHSHRINLLITLILDIRQSLTLHPMNQAINIIYHKFSVE